MQTQIIMPTILHIMNSCGLVNETKKIIIIYETGSILFNMKILFQYEWREKFATVLH